MDLRDEFVLKAKAPGANIAELCREYSVSRKTGYKWLARFAVGGTEALADMSRRPGRGIETSGEVVLRIQELRRAHPRWGPKKLRVLLQRLFPTHEAPSVKTVQRILARLGEPRIRRPRRSPQVIRPTPRHDVSAPNDLWTVDFKGWWRTRDGSRCEPLTVRDAFSRFVLTVTLVGATATANVRKVFERLFAQHGLPSTIHVDNGPPFGCVKARCGLTQLSAWWVAVGVKVAFSRPGHPEDNGGHERMHEDIRFELEDVSADHPTAQQAACDRWVHEFNHVRPHEALQMRTPAELYRRSARPFRGVRAPRYPLGFDVRKVKMGGAMDYQGHRLFVGNGFHGHVIGVERVATTTLRLWLYEQDLGLLELPELASDSSSGSVGKSGAVTQKTAGPVTRTKPRPKKRPAKQRRRA